MTAEEQPRLYGERPRVTQDQIVVGLKAVGIAAGDTVLAHSSLSAFGHVEGGADAVIDALLTAIGPEGTLVLPTFTWSAFHDKERVVFDLANTPCETGRIPETFRHRPGVVRSAHVCHSVAVCGPHAQACLGDGVHPFGRGSSFDALCRLNAWSLLMGVTFSSCTALHSAEELEQVPYRAYRDFRGSEVVYPDGRRAPCASVEYLRQDGAHSDFEKAEALFAEAGVLRIARVGNARLINSRIRDVIHGARAWLRKDAYFLSRWPVKKPVA